MNVELKGSKKDIGVAKAMIDFIYSSPFLTKEQKVKEINELPGVRWLE
jgi:hypothetical protein